MTMGPPQAREAMVEALALGCDRAVHIVDRAFAGSDTLATARAPQLIPVQEGFDIVFAANIRSTPKPARLVPRSPSCSTSRRSPASPSWR